MKKIFKITRIILNYFFKKKLTIFFVRLLIPSKKLRILIRKKVEKIFDEKKFYYKKIKKIQRKNYLY